MIDREYPLPLWLLKAASFFKSSGRINE